MDKPSFLSFWSRLGRALSLGDREASVLKSEQVTQGAPQGCPKLIPKSNTSSGCSRKRPLKTQPNSSHPEEPDGWEAKHFLLGMEHKSFQTPGFRLFWDTPPKQRTHQGSQFWKHPPQRKDPGPCKRSKSLESVEAGRASCLDSRSLS